MNLDAFLTHYGINQNPFGAEEALHDSIYLKLLANSASSHPDIDKILGKIEQPCTSVVFGEKGSGKTAIKMLISQRVSQHNQLNPENKVLLIEYDDLNPFLDRLTKYRQAQLGFKKSAKISIEQLLEGIRLEDHQDAILSLATTQIVDACQGHSQTKDEKGKKLKIGPIPRKSIKRWPKRQRNDLAVLASLYDQPTSGSLYNRWATLRSQLRLGFKLPVTGSWLLASGSLILAGVLYGATFFFEEDQMITLFSETIAKTKVYNVLAIIALVGSAIAWGVWGIQKYSLWQRCRKIIQQIPSVSRNTGDLEVMIREMGSAANEQPWPSQDSSTDQRYQLTQKLLGILKLLDYKGMMVLVDRVDEPTLVSGQGSRMKQIIWPMLDNKFLQQIDIGFKLLLPIELRHLLRRETAEFFQEARLDKQNLIDRLSWSGATLYDLCSQRLNTCRNPDQEPLSLVGLFAEDVSREMVIDALDQMLQPRDAFKFLYAVLQEHCKMVPQENPEYRIPKLTLESIRRIHSQRVQELQRGLTPS